MNKLLAFFRERLWVKITLPLLALVAGALGIVIFDNVQTQKALLRDQVKRDCELLIVSIEQAMFSSLAKGDNETVREQLLKFRERTSGLEILVFGPDRVITFSTAPESIGSRLESFAGQKVLTGMGRMLETGEYPKESLDDTLDGFPALAVFRPILNEQQCHQCHGSSSKVLGGIEVRTSTKEAILAAGAARKRSIASGAIALVFLMFLIYVLSQVIVNRQVRRLLELGGRMRKGDLTSEIEIKGRDEISHMCARMNLVNADLREMIASIVAASQSVSEVTCQQAAAVEETSTSLNEVATMTRQNAENTKKASELVEEVNLSVDQAKRSMEELTRSMDSISRVSHQASNIVRSIDEIAFQTNLLALNAAVEAARAGQVGAGFTVVAEEVRSLARRAAEAARNSSSLIDDTIREIGAGVQVVERTSGIFSGVAAGISDVVARIGEISQASGEQAFGLEQINGVLSEIDKAIQHNVTSAEKLALAASRFKISGDKKSAE